MNILSIETSCDETGVSLVECTKNDETISYRVLGNALLSQAKLHAEYGGVFPSLAKREHAKAIVPLIEGVLKDAGLSEETSVDKNKLGDARALLLREPEVQEALEKLARFDTKSVNAIAVTVGPGLAPALWVGVNVARALSVLWNKPLLPVNHMHGHIFSALFPKAEMYTRPALTLLVSGGHTEILKLDSDMSLTLLGTTRDDAIGEAFDKAARILGLGYPGGPEISKWASEHRKENPDHESTLLPRPMMSDNSLDVSYSGLKTALLYHVRDNPPQSDEDTAHLAREFEDAALDVILAKVRKALEDESLSSIIVGGGVIANTELRRRLELLAEEYDIPLHLPLPELTTDNSLMIAVAAFVSVEYMKKVPNDVSEISAQANLASHALFS